MQQDPHTKVTTAVSIARDILDMHERIEVLEWENARLREYEEKYHQLLNQSLAHSQHMVGQVIALALKPGVMEALAAPLP